MKDSNAARKSEVPDAPRVKPKGFSRRDREFCQLAKREEQERCVAGELDALRKDGKLPKGVIREVVKGLAGKYEFLDRERFVRELGDRVEPIPDSMSLVRYLVSTFMIYEFTKHQDLTIKCADFCICNGGGHGMVSAYATMLSNILENMVEAGLPEEARRAAMEDILKLAGRFQPFGTIRVIAEISQFAYSISLPEPEIKSKHLPLPAPDPFLSFLLSLDNALSALSSNPSAAAAFLTACMDISRNCRADLFLSSISIIGWAAKLDETENKKFVDDALAALGSLDMRFLKVLEDSLMKNKKSFPSG